MMRCFICILVISFSTVCKAQVSDSLYKALPDTLRPKNKGQLSQPEKLRIAYHVTGNVATSYYKELHAMVLELEAEMAKSHHQQTLVLYAQAIAAFYANSGHYNRALAYFLKVIGFAGANPRYNHQVAEAFIMLGGMYTIRANKQDTAAYLLHKGLDMIAGQKDSMLLLNAYNGYRAIYEKLNQYAIAIAYCNKALAAVPKNKKWEEDYTILIMAKADMYAKLYQQEAQKKYADSANGLIGEIMEAKKNFASNWYAYCYFMLGSFQLWAGNFKPALSLFDSCLLPKYIRHSLYYDGLDDLAALYRTVCLVKLGSPGASAALEKIHINKGNYVSLQLRNRVLYENAKANGNWMAAMGYYENYVQNTDSLAVMAQRGKVFEVEQKYALAQKEAAIARLEKKNLMDSLDLLMQKQAILTAEGNYALAQKEAAIKELEKRGLIDSFNVISQKNKLLQAEQKYLAAQKEADIAGLNNMNLRATATRNKILFGSLATILILVLAFFVRNKRQYAERKKMTDALHNMELEMELSQLKQQAEKEAAIEGQRKSISANLHDEIGANLAALRFFINDQEKRAKNAEAKAVLSDIADEVQTIYIRSREFMHELSKGKNPSNYNVADLLQNLELRFGAQSSVQVHVNADDEEIRKSFTPLQHAEMYRVIREAVANSLKHSGASDIYISLGSDLKGFNFEIRDNGNGTANSKEAGMGMSAMAERLKILKGNFKVEGINTGIVISGNFPITG